MIEKVIGAFTNQNALTNQKPVTTEKSLRYDRLTKGTTKNINAARYEYGLVVLL